MEAKTERGFGYDADMRALAVACLLAACGDNLRPNVGEVGPPSEGTSGTPARGVNYVVDVRSGLDVLRYHGRRVEQVAQRMYREGNSNR